MVLENKTPENVLEWFESPHSINVLATINGDIVGVGLLNSENGYLSLCYILPSVSGKGVGKEIILYLEKKAKKAKLNKIYFTSTIGAKNFYEKWGAKVIGQEANPTNEAMNPVMEKIL